MLSFAEFVISIALKFAKSPVKKIVSPAVKIIPTVVVGLTPSSLHLTD